MRKNKKQRGSITSTSLVSKLNFQLWVRRLGTFIKLNVLFLVVSAFLLFYLGEQEAKQTISYLQENTYSSLGFNQRMGELEILEGKGFERGFFLPKGFQVLFPPETREAERYLSISTGEDVGLYHLFDDLHYKFFIELDGEEYTIVVHYFKQILVLKNLFLVLLAFQVIIIFRSILTQAELIRKNLQPISELAQQAQSLSQEKGTHSLAQMEALAGTLDEITAARLDTRIDLETTQHELKSVASAINSLLERINESYRLQARFVADASHELRTPIAAIQGYVNLLDRWGKDDPEALQESIDAIKEEAANMKDLVEQLLFLARGDNQSIHIDLEHFDLGNLAQIIHRETKMINETHQFKIETKEAWVTADQGLIKQAGRILIDNAIKYTPVGGKISLIVRTNEGKVWFTVQDLGIGIPPADLPHIFERFYRADDSRARVSGGTGLGLSIAKWIVERHGGYLEVLSREDFGTRISFVLPESKTN